jgi:hypothetical protein
VAVPSSYRVDDPVLQEMHDRWTYATNEWKDIRDEAKTDMRYVAGDPWNAADRAARKAAGRVCLSLDELGQYVNQLINEVRQHKRAIQVTPLGNGANDTTANFRANLIRQIEYRSNAQQAYTTAFENTVQRSYGFFRIKPQYVHDRSDEQELLIDPLPNPDLVTIDPDILKPDGSDMRYAWIAESWAIPDFKRRFPKAKITSFSPDVQAAYPQWVSDQRVQIAEYWRVEMKPETLFMLQTPEGGKLGVFESERTSPAGALMAAWPVLSQRKVDRKSVTQVLTNGIEILETNEFPGTSIPIVCCFGKVLYVDEGSGAKRKIMSLVRLARDPQMLYCYYRTAEAEQVGMSTKFPYFIRRGSLKPEEKNKLAESLHQPVAFIEVEMTGDTMLAGTMPEMPVRNPFEPAIQALEVGAEGARRAIQAAMGISPLPTSAQRKNEKSGVALQEMRNAEQQGSYHFIDHYEAAITRGGVILNELIPHYYDTARDVAVRTPADETSIVRINDPQAPDKESGEPIAADQGEHDVTLSTGPSMDSEREAASNFADNLAQNPQVFPVIGDLVVKLKNLGPIGDEIADRLHKMLPPQLQAQEGEGEPLPPQVMAQMEQAQKMIDLLTKEVEKRTKQAETDEIKIQGQMQIEQMRQEFETKRTALEQSTKVQIEKMKIVADLLKTRATLEQQQTEAMIDAATGELDREVAAAGEREARQAVSVDADRDRQHQASEAERSRMHQAGQSDADRAFQAEQAAQHAAQEAASA